MVLRHDDSSTAWTAQPDVLGRRVYPLQNWRADVVAVHDGGMIAERLKYSAYGVPFCVSAADFDADGDVDSADSSAFYAAQSAEDPSADLNLDGVVDFNDILEWIGVYNAGETGGRSVLSRASIRNRLGYAGYQHDPSITGSGQGSGQSKYHVRHRVCDASVGRWTRRDPLGYVSGPTVYQYVNSEPLIGADPSGLMRVRCGGGLEYCREPEPLPAFVEPLFPLVVPRAIAPATGVWVCTPLGATVVCCATVGVLVYCVTDKELREASKIKECERLHAEYEESCKAAGAGGNSKAAECNEFDDCLTLCLKWARNDDCVKKREEHRDKGCWDLRAPPREPHRGRWIEQHKNSIRRYSDNRKNCAELIRNYHRRRGGPPCDCGFPVHD